MKKFDKKSKFCAPLFYDEKIIIISNDMEMYKEKKEEGEDLNKKKKRNKDEFLIKN